MLLLVCYFTLQFFRSNKNSIRMLSYTCTREVAEAAVRGVHPPPASIGLKQQIDNYLGQIFIRAFVAES
jgi:hypothetical protein